MQSDPVVLEAGKRYYIEAIHAEGGGGDYISVGWKVPDGLIEIIGGEFLSPYAGR